MDPRCGDVNGDGVQDLIIGVNDLPNSVRIYLKNADGTIKNDCFPGCINYTKEARPTADFVDYNGDGLLDIAVTIHATVLGKQNYIEIFLNKGTKENPSFVGSDPLRVQADGHDIAYNFMNFVFSDINKDSKPDLLLVKTDVETGDADYYMALNTGTANAIVLGKLQPLIHNGVPLKTDVCKLSYGNCLCLAYYDTDNDGVKELYVNATQYRRYTSKPWVHSIPGKPDFRPYRFQYAITSDGIRFAFPFDVARIALYTLYGEKIAAAAFNAPARTGVLPLNAVSPGRYIVTMAGGTKRDKFTISVLK